MDVSLIVSGTMALLTPFLTKASEKAAETIGEKLANKATEKKIWEKVKGLFIKEDEEEVATQIENKPVATLAEISKIEERISTEANSNSQFAKEIKTILNITSHNEFVASEKLNSIQRLQNEIQRLQIQMERAGVATSGDYLNTIELKEEKLQYQIDSLYKILELNQ